MTPEMVKLCDAGNAVADRLRALRSRAQDAQEQGLQVEAHPSAIFSPADESTSKALRESLGSLPSEGQGSQMAALASAAYGLLRQHELVRGVALCARECDSSVVMHPWEIWESADELALSGWDRASQSLFAVPLFGQEEA